MSSLKQRENSLSVPQTLRQNRRVLQWRLWDVLVALQTAEGHCLARAHVCVLRGSNKNRAFRGTEERGNVSCENKRRIQGVWGWMSTTTHLLIRVFSPLRFHKKDPRGLARQKGILKLMHALATRKQAATRELSLATWHLSGWILNWPHFAKVGDFWQLRARTLVRALQREFDHLPGCTRFFTILVEKMHRQRKDRVCGVRVELFAVATRKEKALP